jgi:hypothetical protein
METKLVKKSAIYAALLVPALLGAAPENFPGIIDVGPGHHLKRHTEPRNDSEVVDPELPDGAKVEIVCTRHGDHVTGTYGTTDIWDRLSIGGYVPDSFVYATRAKPVEGECD